MRAIRWFVLSCFVTAMQYTYVHVQDDCVIVAQDDITHKIHFCSRMLFYVSALQGMTQKKTFFHSDQANQSSSRQRERERMRKTSFPSLLPFAYFQTAFPCWELLFKRARIRTRATSSSSLELESWEETASWSSIITWGRKCRQTCQRSMRCPINLHTLSRTYSFPRYVLHTTYSLSLYAIYVCRAREGLSFSLCFKLQPKWGLRWRCCLAGGALIARAACKFRLKSKWAGMHLEPLAIYRLRHTFIHWHPYIQNNALCNERPLQYSICILHTYVCMSGDRTDSTVSLKSLLNSFLLRRSLLLCMRLAQWAIRNANLYFLKSGSQLEATMRIDRQRVCLHPSKRLFRSAAVDHRRFNGIILKSSRIK